MILGDLLGARVLDSGTTLGHVIDVRLAVQIAADPGDRVPDAPLADRVGRRDAVGRAEVVGLLVSPRSGSSFLGFERTGVRSPALIAALVRRRHRGTFLVPWQQVEAIGAGTVTLTAGFDRLDPRLD